MPAPVIDYAVASEDPCVIYVLKDRNVSYYDSEIVQFFSREGKYKRSNSHTSYLFKINKTNECEPSEDSDQPGHPPSLMRIFAARLIGS